MPSFPCLVSENYNTGNDISYYNGWTETYDPEAGAGSCEPLMDWENEYSRMWIESQNEARIIVRWRAALVSSEGNIAHTGAPRVVPYGPGDWVDEWYYIYPDGSHVRKSMIYTYYAPQSKPFGWDREPPNYVHEFQEMLFLGNVDHDGRVPEDDIKTKALTLIKMDGSDSTISYKPYPIHFGPSEEELYKAFGSFWNANIAAIHTKSDYQPFLIGRQAGVSISPYATEQELPLPRVFQSWPMDPGEYEGYHGAALGHMLNRDHDEQTETTISQIYLSGWTNSSQPETTLVPLGKSWLQAPDVTNQSGCEFMKYDKSQRAYIIIAKDEELSITLNGSSDHPVYNPCLLIKNWNSDSIADLSIDGQPKDWNTNNRFGVETNKPGGKDAAIWIKAKSSTQVKLTVSGANPDTVAPKPNPLTWKVEPALFEEDSLAVSMSATEASDPNGVEYFFECLDDSTLNSQWQESTAYSVSELEANSKYSFRIKARDGGLNETEWSEIKSIITGGLQPNYYNFIGAGHDKDVTAKASSSDESAVAQNTINGSGLTEQTHSTEWIDTWTSDGGNNNPPASSPNPARDQGQWVHYDLGYQYQLGQMHIWNGNEIPGRGINNVTIEYSKNDTAWEELGNYDFPQASGSGNYTGFEGPDFAGVEARYVLLTIHSNHGDEFGYALSEIRINLSDASGIKDHSSSIPGKIELKQNYPNPFNPKTNIKFGLDKSNFVKLDVINIIGEKVRTLVNKDIHAGYHRVTFNGKDLASGIYYYRLKAGKNVKTKKCLLLK